MQNVNLEQEAIHLSKEKWRWMSERNVDALAAVFHEKAVFVHMGATMSKDQELEVIRSGQIHYKAQELRKQGFLLPDRASRHLPRTLKGAIVEKPNFQKEFPCVLLSPNVKT